MRLIIIRNVNNKHSKLIAGKEIKENEKNHTYHINPEFF